MRSPSLRTHRSKAAIGMRQPAGSQSFDGSDQNDPVIRARASSHAWHTVHCRTLRCAVLPQRPHDLERMIRQKYRCPRPDALRGRSVLRRRPASAADGAPAEQRWARPCTDSIGAWPCRRTPRSMPCRWPRQRNGGDLRHMLPAKVVGWPVSVPRLNATLIAAVPTRGRASTCTFMHVYILVCARYHGA